MDDFEELRYNLSRHIGFDVAVINADDESAHLDTAALLFSLAGLAIVSYCVGFIESAAKELGEKTWKEIRDKASQVLRKGPQEPIGKDQEEVEEEVFVLYRKTVVVLQEEGLEVRLRSGNEAAKQDAAKFLASHNFPKGKASEIVEVIESKLLPRL